MLLTGRAQNTRMQIAKMFETAKTCFTYGILLNYFMPVLFDRRNRDLKSQVEELEDSSVKLAHAEGKIKVRIFLCKQNSCMEVCYVYQYTCC